MWAGAVRAAVAPSLIVSAFLMTLGLGASSHRWLVWLALLPLFVCIRVYRAGPAMLCGGLWGFCLYVFSVAGVDGRVVDRLLPLALATAVPAVYTCLGSWLTRRIGFCPFVLGVSWMGVEVAFGSIGLRTGLPTAAHGDGALLHWVGGALGSVLAAFLVAWVNAALVVVLSRVPVGSGVSRYIRGSADCATYLVAHTIPYVPLFAIGPSRPRAPPIVVPPTV